MWANDAHLIDISLYNVYRDIGVSRCYQKRHLHIKQCYTVIYLREILAF